VTPSQSGHHREATRAPPSFAKSRCGELPTASIPKTSAQPEEPNSKRSQPYGNNASTGISRVPPTRQQMRGPTSHRQDAPHSVQATTGNARTKDPNGVRAGHQRPADSTPQPSHRGARNMRLHAARRWQDRQHTAESGSSFQIKRRVRPAGACPHFAAGRAAEMVRIACCLTCLDCPPVPWPVAASRSRPSLGQSRDPRTACPHNRRHRDR